jgi:hypothetical protein
MERFFIKIYGGKINSTRLLEEIKNHWKVWLFPKARGSNDSSYQSIVKNLPDAFFKLKSHLKSQVNQDALIVVSVCFGLFFFKVTPKNRKNGISLISF